MRETLEIDFSSQPPCTATFLANPLPASESCC